MAEWVITADEQELCKHILHKQDREELLVDVSEWGCQILLRAMSGKQRFNFLSFQTGLDPQDSERAKKMYAQAIQQCACHPTTKLPIFKLGHMGTLMDEKNGAVLDMLGQMALTISHIDGSVSARIKKNFERMLSSSDTTNS